MKVLAINGSPHGKDGNTDIILQNLLLGMEQAGSEVETIYLNKLNIKPCLGCFSCWFKTPGKCVLQDDMQEILSKLNDFDLIIYATPLYIYSTTGIMKNFLDRSISLQLPFLIENKKDPGFTRHPNRFENNKIQKMFLVSSAGFPEMKYFSALVQTFKYKAQTHDMEYLGEILMPGAGAFKIPAMQDNIDRYKKDLQTAGKQLSEQGKIDDDLLTRVHRPLMKASEYRDCVNNHFRKKLGE
ncbi:MAG: flavodoxin family protein [Gammaproteobacteria bacterium]|nr:flavodoxin family protein [Gammaproteobacteria bacterium]